MPIRVTPGPELIVVARPEATLRATPSGLRSLAGADVGHLTRMLDGASAKMRPLFGATEDRLEAVASRMRSVGTDVPQLSRYYRVDAPSEALESLAATLAASPHVAAAYVKPPVEPAGLNEMVAQPADAPPSTPDFGGRQGYLDAAPGGINARYAWTLPGGRGSSVGIIDVEGAWNFAHEDLTANQGGVIGGNPTTDPDWINHGTAVLGVFSGDGVGVTGICPDANVRAISVFGPIGSAGAIHMAADRLNPGDIILIELHRPGPRFNFQSRPDQLGFIAVEWWPDDYDAIRYATSKGIIVVEAAGNGGENLDDPIYDAPAPGFPSGWSNPFRRDGWADSGAILVGAGAPPPGTHGASWGPDRSRLDFSNYCAAVDVQGWGREVTTTGYGDLQGGSSPNAWYTDRFSGTSSASPVVVGALGCAQGILRASGVPMTPAQARAMLRSTGSPQQDGPAFPAAQRIGNRPDLRQMIGALGVESDPPVPLFRYWRAGTSNHFYTTNWAELGSGNAAWVYEGVIGLVHLHAIPGAIPLYRYWNASLGDHFYTTNFLELGAGGFGWVHEGVACYVHDQAVAGAVPLHRYWNAVVADHFYTTNWNELGNGKFGWAYEGVACYVHLQAGTTPAAPPSALPGTPPGAPAGMPDNDADIPATFRTTRPTGAPDA